MGLNAGEWIRITATGEHAEIVDRLDRDSLLVVLDGIEFPVLIEDIEEVVPDHVSRGSDQKVTKAEVAERLLQTGLNTTLDRGKDKGLRVAMEPNYQSDGLIEYLYISLINDSGWALKFDFKLVIDEEVDFKINRVLGGREQIQLTALYFEDINFSPRLEFEFTNPDPEASSLQQFAFTHRPKGKHFLKDPSQPEGFDRPCYPVVLCKHLPEDKRKAILKKADKEAPKSKLDLSRYADADLMHPAFNNYLKVKAKEMVIDLHLEAIPDKPKNLSNRAKLDLQLEHFQQNLREAIREDYARMIVIHGVGSGKLKSEIFKVLRDYPEVKSFHNEFDPRFGHGASIIEL